MLCCLLLPRYIWYVQISVKFYQLVVQDPLMRLCSPKESAVEKEKTSGGNPLTAFVKAILKDNINIAILAGLAMYVRSHPVCGGLCRKCWHRARSNKC